MEINTQKKHTILLLLLFGAIGSFYSCKKNNAIIDLQRPVVEGYLLPGQPILIKVYYQKYLEDTISYGFPITGLDLKISDGSQTVSLNELKDGNYTYADGNFIRAGKTYALNFSYLDQTISAQTTMPSKPLGFTASALEQEVPRMSFGSDSVRTFKPITFNWQNSGQEYYMLAIKNIDENRVRINPRGDFYPSKNSEILVGQFSLYKTEAMTFNYSGLNRVILLHVNKEYSQALTTNLGTSTNLNNPYSNVVNGLGIFTAMQADTLQINVYQPE